jgi:C4-dicarboxylate-binding protein DctP
VLNLSAAERSQWVDVMKPVWKKFEKKIGKDLIDAAYASNN